MDEESSNNNKMQEAKSLEEIIKEDKSESSSPRRHSSFTHPRFPPSRKASLKERHRDLKSMRSMNLYTEEGEDDSTHYNAGFGGLTEPRRGIETPDFSRHLGAAPGTLNPAFLMINEQGAFPPLIEGRGTLPKNLPDGTSTWRLHKWVEQLDLKPFAPKTEIEMEQWFVEGSKRIRAHECTANIAIKVMEQAADTHYSYVLTSILHLAPLMTEIEHIADAIAARTFMGNIEVEQLELTLLQQQAKETVTKAFTSYRSMEECYLYMCRRRQRQPIIGQQQQIALAMALIPTSVAQAIRRARPDEEWEPLRLFSHALKMEGVIQREKPVYIAPVFQNEPHDADMGEERALRPCPACTGMHLKKHCPHKKSRCKKCTHIGHTSAACRTKIITDSTGRQRLLAAPTQRGAIIQTRFDNTMPDQLQSVAGVVDKLLSTTEQERERAKSRYVTKKKEENPDYRPKTTLPRDVLLTTPFQCTEIDLSDQDAGIEEDGHEVYTLDFDMLPKIPKKRRLLEVSLMINNTLINCILDSGALIDVMSKETASALKIEEKEGSTIKIKNVNQCMCDCNLSDFVSVKIPNTTKLISTQFALLPEKVPTLISEPTMESLELKIDFNKRIVEYSGVAIPCNLIEPLEASEETESNALIRQQDFKDVETTIVTNSEKWSALLNPMQVEAAKALFIAYSDLWFSPKVGRCTTIQMKILVRGTPRRVSARPTPVHLRDELNRQIDDLLKAGVIESKPDCKWVSPCHLVPKPRSTKWRLVIDYRYVNTLVEDDSYQVPNTSDLLIRLSGAKIFTLIDLNWGFWNVSLDPSSYDYTGFVVPERGVFIWKVMPFGLKTSPTIFQRAIEKALRSVIDQGNVSVYIDDIIIFTKTVDEHLKVLKQVLDLLRLTGFYINFEKMQLLREEVLYLGHLISSNTLKPDTSKIKALVHAEAPKDKKSLLSFCAAANFLRIYIPRFSELVEPLTTMTGKYVKFKWGPKEQVAFEAIKEAIINAVYLTMPDWSKPFVLFTDASEVAIAAAMAQSDENENGLNFIAFASKKLNETQRNWSPTERELYAIVWACEHFENYLKGSKPLIYSDHKSLEHLLTLESPKIKRWALRLSEYSPHVTHIGGEYNNVADWLSRSVPEEEDELPEHVFVPSIYHLVHEAANDFLLPNPDEFAAEARTEETELPAGTLDWYNGTAFGRRTKRIFIPKRYRMQILLWFHMSRFGGHQGVTRTTNRLRKYVWWPDMQQTIVDFINTCPLCNAIKPLKSMGGVQGALNKPNLFQLISIDFIGPRTYMNKKIYIMIIVDHYSRFMVSIPLESIETPASAKALRSHWVTHFGAPLAVLADRDPVFTANHFKNYVLKNLKSRLHFVSKEYPQGNGINESSHRILETALNTYPWKIDTEIEQVISDATLLYNVTPNRLIGDTPASLMFGCDLHLPGLEDFESTASEEARLQQLRNFRGARLLLSQLRELEEFSVPSTGRSKTIDFKVGDIVTYRLTRAESNKSVHITKEHSYNMNRSMPQRVTKVTATNVTMIPLWTRGAPRVAPKEQCKLLTTFIPDLLRDEVQRLYPSLPWLQAADQRIEKAILKPQEEMIESSSPGSPEATSSKKRRRS